MYHSEHISKFLATNISIVEYESKKMVGVNFYREIDLTQIESIRLKEKIPYTAFVIKATAKAISEFEYVNARIFENILFRFVKKIIKFPNIDVAVAIERDSPGLEAVAFCDIVRNADTVKLPQLTGILKSLAAANESNNEQWKSFSQTISKWPTFLTKIIFRLPCFLPSMWIKYRGGCVVVSSPAKYGVDMIGANWVWPLGVSFGLVKKRVLVKEDQMVICPTFFLTLSFDRRMLAGAQTAKFFNRIVYYLENPALLL